MQHPDQPAFLVASRLIRDGRETDLQRWADRFDAAAGTHPGYRGAMRLDQPGGLTHLVHRFASDGELATWRGSDEHRRLTAEADAYSVQETQTAFGIDVRLDLPSEAAVPKWKNWLATLAAVFPISLAINLAFDRLPAKVPSLVQVAVTSVILTATLTWVILPRIRKHLRSWLLGGADGGLRRDRG